MLKIKNLQVSVEDKRILNGVNLSIGTDEIHVIMGPNGVGKSTICKAIMHHPDYKITGGSIKFKDTDITEMTTDKIAQKGIFFLMQNPTEIPGVTNAEMLRTALVDRGIKSSIFEFNKEMDEATKALDIDKSFIHHNINERMSGGEKKKNELLQLYILKPSLILLDELDSGLDIDSLKSLSKVLLEYKDSSKCSILLITHHTNILEYIKPDKVHILEEGRIVTSGDMSLAENVEKRGFKGAFNIDDGEYNE